MKVEVGAQGARYPTGAEPAEQWTLLANTTLHADGHTFTLTPNGPETNVTLTTRRVKADKRYTIFFRYRNGGLDGEERVYVSAQSDDGRWLDTFPDGTGFPCARSIDWVQQGFAFTTPPSTTSLTIWLRASGDGSAQFDSVELRPLP
jgi:hypothetical protein